MINNLLKFTYMDAAEPWQIGFQDSASPAMTGIVDLHNDVFYYLTVILLGVSWILGLIIYYFNKNNSPIAHKYWTHGTVIELVWTITPALVLMLIAQPSFALLYVLDEVISPSITIKAVGLIFYGPKLYILHNIEDTLISNQNKGQKNIKLKKCFHTRVRAINRIGPHDSEVLALLIGTLLGDSYANKRYSEGTRFSFRQSIVHKEYLFWLYNFLFTRGYCSNLLPRKYIRRLKVGEIKKEYYGYEFNTYTFRSFDWIHDMFYKKGKKVINEKIFNYFSPLSLAIWIMDDGCWTGNGLRIATNSYSYQELEMIKIYLEKKYNLISTIQKIWTKVSVNKDNQGLSTQYSIYITSKSIHYLRELVLPFMHKKMYYKLGL